MCANKKNLPECGYEAAVRYAQQIAPYPALPEKRADPESTRRGSGPYFDTTIRTHCGPAHARREHRSLAPDPPPCPPPRGGGGGKVRRRAGGRWRGENFAGAPPQSLARKLAGHTIARGRACTPTRSPAWLGRTSPRCECGSTPRPCSSHPPGNQPRISGPWP